ncbi:uncharacterized protein N7459_000639 [Penicillium hispanicum]|uniref:uncharacterized protein n=1 Tax=Penicillium hispanicum TaxID=1080232 RepID=UPI0025404C9E|nr:uncharacterized protein N7459_000639 [Penicillium hispanicum]KAJ5594431.1 hypothetical protein N7459_000639 [Penicillium hispanicum]
MTDVEPVHFFDIISTLPGASKSWSPNTLKVRSVLNFKGIPYTQSWISYPDIAPLIKGFGVPPNAVGTPYTLPAIVHKSSITDNPDGAMMDSLPIVTHLDKLYPSPPLFPSGDASFALYLAVNKIASLMGPFFRVAVIPRVAECLDPRGKEYFERTRSAVFGKPLSEVRPTDPEELASLWTLVETESKTLLKMLEGREGKKGPFLEGETPSYADLVLSCHFAFLERMDPEYFEKFLALGNGEFKALWEACSAWVSGQGEDKEWPVPQPTA